MLRRQRTAGPNSLERHQPLGANVARLVNDPDSAARQLVPDLVAGNMDRIMRPFCRIDRDGLTQEKRLQVLRQGRGAWIAPRRFLLQTAQTDTLQRRGDVRMRLRRWDRLLKANLIEGLKE